MSTRGGTKRDLWRAIAQKDARILELSEENERLRQEVARLTDYDGPFNDGERLTRDGMPYTDRHGCSYMGDRPGPDEAP